MENNKGYWIYSILTIIFFVCLFAFGGWLIYDLVLKLADKDFSNNTVIQALITLIVTVFIGGYFSKRLEFGNNKKLELYKIQTAISLKLIDLSSEYYRNFDNKTIKSLLIFESSKVKLYFKDEVLVELNRFIETKKEKDLINNFNQLMDKLKSNIK